jgi:hypothetical protein
VAQSGPIFTSSSGVGYGGASLDRAGNKVESLPGGLSSGNRLKQRAPRSRSRGAALIPSGQDALALQKNVGAQAAPPFSRPRDAKLSGYTQQMMQIKRIDEEEKHRAEATAIAERKRVRLETAPSKDHQRILRPDYQTPFGSLIDGRIDAWQRLVPYHCVYSATTADLDEKDWQDRINDLVASYAGWVVRLRKEISDIDLRFEASHHDPVALSSSQGLESERKRPRNGEKAFDTLLPDAGKERLRKARSADVHNDSGNGLQKHSGKEAFSVRNGMTNGLHGRDASAPGSRAKVLSAESFSAQDPTAEMELSSAVAVTGTDLSLTDEIVLQRLLFDDEENLRVRSTADCVPSALEQASQPDFSFEARERQSETHRVELTPPGQGQTESQPCKPSQMKGDIHFSSNLAQAGKQETQQLHRSPNIVSRSHKGSSLERLQQVELRTPLCDVAEEIAHRPRLEWPNDQTRGQQHGQAASTSSSALHRPENAVESKRYTQDPQHPEQGDEQVFGQLQCPIGEQRANSREHCQDQNSKELSERSATAPSKPQVTLQSQSSVAVESERRESLSPFAESSRTLGAFRNTENDGTGATRGFLPQQPLLTSPFFALGNQSHHELGFREPVEYRSLDDRPLLHASGPSANLILSPSRAVCSGEIAASMDAMPQISRAEGFSGEIQLPHRGGRS